MRKPLIAANWKMYKTPAEAAAYAESFLPLVAGHVRDEIVVCPCFLALSTLVHAFSGSEIAVGAQDMHTEAQGAFTGEISGPMLCSIGVTHAILGHSERRHYNCETDWDVNRKLHAALAHGVIPIVCVGEVQEEREEGRTNDVLLRQVKIALEGIKPEDAGSIVMAYEPVWAIGTGQSASPEMAAEVHGVVRHAVAERLGPAVAAGMRILYGGSVKPENARSLLDQPEIDGALVGGASLNPASFAGIVNY
ncbi:MAG TPA: triose-phosphate isomerase [Acidobacteriaceae bacterium]